MTMQSDIGLIGLAVMGENLVLNMESKGFSVAVFNRTTAVTEKFVATRGKGKNIIPTATVEELVGALKPPRKVMMMIKAGKPVDQVIAKSPRSWKKAMSLSTAATRSLPIPNGASTISREKEFTMSAAAFPAARKARSRVRRSCPAAHVNLTN